MDVNCKKQRVLVCTDQRDSLGQGSISIGGVVKDPDGAVVAGASVSLISQDNTTRVLAISDQRGHYEFDHLSQGDTCFQ